MSKQARKAIHQARMASRWGYVINTTPSRLVALAIKLEKENHA